jgi:hypothetical protein
MAMRPEYKKFLQEAKRLGIKTHDELYNLCLNGHDTISGGEFESAKTILKIKS